MFIKINKSSADDCPYNCPFRKVVIYNEASSGIECTLFNESLRNIGYYDSRDYEACFQCQEMYKDQEVS